MNKIAAINRMKSSYYNTVQVFERPNGDLCINIGHNTSPDDDVLIILPLGQQNILFWDDPDNQGFLNLINEGG